MQNSKVRILVFLSLCLVHIHAKKCTTSLSGVALAGHTIKSYQSETIHHCNIDCTKNLACRSINYYFERLLCQHNSAKMCEKPGHRIEDSGAVYFDNSKAIEIVPKTCHVDYDGWVLVARFSNSDRQNWMASDGAWWYDSTTAQGDIASTTVNQDMIAPAFWTVKGQEIKITRTDDPTHTALLVTTSNCLGGQTFRAKLTSYGDFRNRRVWATDKCLGRCRVNYGGNYAKTAGFSKASCDGNIQKRNQIGFWCHYVGDGAIMMIGGGGNACDRADHGIGVTEESEAQFGGKQGCNFGNCVKLVSRKAKCFSRLPYALNLWIK